MDNDQLNRLFRDDLNDLQDEENLRAIIELRLALKQTAREINKYVQESASKNDIMTRLFRIGVDAELAIRMDGISRTTPMIVVKQ